MQIASDQICLKLSVFTSLAPACGEKEQLRRPVVYLAAGRLAARAHRIMRRRCAGRARLPASIVRTRVYEPATLLSGDVLFDEIGVLQSREFNREAVLDVAHYAARRLADCDHHADWRTQIGPDRDGRAGGRQVDDVAAHIVAGCANIAKSPQRATLGVQD